MALALLAPMVMIGQIQAGAVHDESFQLDGNLVDDALLTEPYDWESFFDASGARVPELPSASRAGFVDSTFKADHAFPDSTTFTSGSKDILDTPGWSCAKSNNLGGKFDIVNAYSTIYADGTDLILYFGVERAATEGDGTMGFWFLKDPSVDCTAGAGGKAPAFGGHHTNGDIFVTAEFSNGGTNAQVQAYAWVGGADGYLDTNAVANGNKCGTATGSADNACGIVNDAPLNPIWPAPDKNGGALDINAFYEGAVRVSGAGGCFATFMANTRSSTSPTATIFDYARGAFPTCQAGTELKLASYQVGTATPVTSGSATPTISVHTGDSLTLTYAETNTGNFALNKPTAGSYVVIPNSSQATACVLGEVQTGGYNNGDTDQDGKLDGGETWLYRCTVSATATTPSVIRAYGHGIDTLSTPGTVKDVTYCDTTTPSNNPIVLPATVATCDSDEITVVSLTVLAPTTSMTASVNATIIFSETNDGNASLDRPTDAAFVRLSGTNQCTSFGPVLKTTGDTTKNTGDANDNGRLDPTETWQWSCTTTIASTASASSVSTATGHGIDTTNGTDVTFCNAGTTTAYQTATWTPSGSTTAVTASPKCDPDEQRTVTIGVG